MYRHQEERMAVVVGNSNSLMGKVVYLTEDGKVYEAGSSVKTINDYKVRITLKDGKYDTKILSE